LPANALLELEQPLANAVAALACTHNWALIHEHYPQFMQLALAIQSGTIAPSAVLAKINSYSTKNRFALALKELGNAVRTTYLVLDRKPSNPSNGGGSHGFLRSEDSLKTLL
jgi:TnpA family transposase